MTSSAPRSPRAHWGLLAVAMFGALLGLALQSLSDGVGRTRTAGTSGQALLGDDWPVVYREGGSLQSRALADRTVALTFDDGPDPTWTPRVLEVLRRENVPATFFVP